MNTNTIKIKRMLDSKQNGAFFKVVIRSTVPTVAKCPDTIEKVTTMTVRKGIAYAAQKSVQEKVAEGKELTHKLPWGRWMDGLEGLFIENNGKEYVRLYCSPNKAETVYLCNGRVVDKAEIEWEVRPSYWKHNDRPDAMTVCTDNLEVL
ncbi:MAG: hypothetical protein J5725_03540 [Bacteroidales bacterium]|nr:hypothetical protein [Bacteroidales bacterium]